MGIISSITGAIAPIFIIISPITSYADQTYSIHRTKSSAGFSMDIPLIMLVASLLRYLCTFGIKKGIKLTRYLCRVFYYPGAKFDISLLIQSFIMIAIQLVLLKVALDHRPSPSSKGGEASLPFVGSREGELGVSRPYNFWQWRSPKPWVCESHPTSAISHWLGYLQILAIPTLPLYRPHDLWAPPFADSDIILTLFGKSWGHWSLNWSYTTGTSDPFELQSSILQGVPVVSPCELDCRWHNENGLVFHSDQWDSVDI